MATKDLNSEKMHATAITTDNLNLSDKDKVDLSDKALAQCIKALRKNWRQGTVACKARAEVALSGKKPWKQKGTGRAHAGTARSPLWRKGGVIFGPQQRVKNAVIPKAMRKQVFAGLLWNSLDNEKIISLHLDVEGNAPKTKQAYNALKSADLHDKKINLFVSHEDMLTHASFSNLPNVRMLLFDQANIYELSDSDYWVFLDKDINAFKEMVNLWI
jgi:large subunit ribosomal protein L4